jgi:phage regulator Rha-like protein
MLQELELVALADGERRIDSRMVAKGIAVQHDNLMQTIRKYQTGLEKYGILLFQTGKIKGRGRPEQFALLNKQQFGYLLMFVRVTNQVRSYREHVYDKFLEYERLLQEPPSQPSLNPLWERRLKDFNRYTKIPDGYWCIFSMIGGYCFNDEFRGVHLVENAVPDVSVGKIWCAYLREQGFDMRLIQQYPHHYPDKRRVQLANIYPNDWLGTFWTWFHGDYLKTHYPSYLKTHVMESQASLLAPPNKQSDQQKSLS